jgi:hypothetical protein
MAAKERKGRKRGGDVGWGVLRTLPVNRKEAEGQRTQRIERGGCWVCGAEERGVSMQRRQRWGEEEPNAK